jgi:hypothetical protein
MIRVRSVYFDPETGEKKRRELPAVFYRKMVELPADRKTVSVELQAVQHVVLEGRFVDSNGHPATGWDIPVFGEKPSDDPHSGSIRWYADAFVERTGEDKGRFRLLLPKGLMDVQLQLVSNEHYALRFQLNKDAPLQAVRWVKLGTVDADLKGILIHRYRSPIVLLRVKGKDGMEPSNVQIKGRYADERIEWGVLIEGPQEDGRFRTKQLLPDEKVLFRITAEGYEPAEVAVEALPEGAVRELEVSLRRADRGER